MKIIHYLKMAWVQARSAKVYTCLYIGGVALAVTITMLLATVLYVKIGPVYPETSRNHTAYLTSVGLSNKETNNYDRWGVGTRLLKDKIMNLVNKEDIGVFIDNSYEDTYIQPADRTEADIKVLTKPCDDGFFRIYDFDVLAGRTVSSDDLLTDSHRAVLTDRLATRLFGSPAEAVGKTVSINFVDYNVIGVVKGASSLTPTSFADVYMPYSCVPEHLTWNYNGGFSVLLRYRDNAQLEALTAEIAEIARTFDDPEWNLHIDDQPTNHLAQTMIPYNRTTNAVSWWEALKYYLMTAFVLLLIPALNLSGMISGRMDSRSGETGLRRAFGAPRASLVNQVLTENLLFTFAGAIIGLGATWIVILTGKSWAFSILDEWVTISQDGLTVSPDMLISPTLFLIVLAVVLILNLLSALIPALRATRRPIVSSLNEKR